MRKHYGHLARVLHWCVDQTLTTELDKLGLTAAQGRIMGYLAHRESPPCSRDVEDEFQLSHPTVSGILSRLEQKGFLEFRPDEKDRRCKRIYVLPRGTESAERMQKTIWDMEERIVQDFTTAEQDQFASLLRRAITNMGGNPCRRKLKEEDTK